MYEPFVVSHIGVGMVFKQVLGHVYWPLLGVVVFLLLRLRPRLAEHRWAWFPILLGGVLGAFVFLLWRLRWLPPYGAVGLGVVFVVSLVTRLAVP